MDIWQGSITVPSVNDTTQSLDNINLSTHLTTPAPSSSVLTHLKTYLSTSTLSFLRYIPPSSVPFYLAAGPSLQVTTTSPATADFLQSFFLSALPKSTCDETDVHPRQPQLSILLQVSPTNSSTPMKHGSWGITQLLLYGALSSPPPGTECPTPPSSPPTRHQTPIITLHALPLSSTTNFTPHLLANSSPLSTSSSNTTPRFIAPNPQDILNPVISSAARKRRAETLDKVVEQKTKKARMPARVLGVLTGSGVNSRARGGSPTPVGRKGSVVGRPGSSGSIVALPSRPVRKEDVAVEARNKDTVNRIVLEEMKRRGMRDYRRTGTEDEDAKEEFKGVFHHAVKAAVFAMRKEMGDGVTVGLERVRNVVRRLVDVFLDGSEKDGGLVVVKKEEEDAEA